MGRLTGTIRHTRMRGRLTRIQDDLQRLRATEQVLVEQVEHFSEIAEDAATRSLVSDSPLDGRASQQAQTDENRHRALLTETREDVARLLEERDRILERLFALDARSRRRDDT